MGGGRLGGPSPDNDAALLKALRASYAAGRASAAGLRGGAFSGPHAG